MRWPAGILVVIAITAAQAAPARADDHITRMPFKVVGGLDVVWRSEEPACFAEAMCDWGGLISYGRDGHGDIERIHFDQDDFDDISGFLTLRGRASSSGGWVFSDPRCQIPAGRQAFSVDVRRAYRGRHRLSLGVADVFPTPIASEECAGPRLGDIAPNLPSAVVDLKRFERPGARVSLAGRFRFHTRWFRGAVVSSLKLVSRRAHTSRLRDEGGPVRKEHALSVSLTYALRSVRGTATATFRGAGFADHCGRYDSCEKEGSARWTAGVGNRTLHVFGIAPMHGRRVPRLREAIQRVARRGVLVGTTSLGADSGKTDIVWAWPNELYCLDSFATEGPRLTLAAAEGRPPRLTIEANGSSPATGNVFEGVCPGPTQADILGSTRLARTLVARDALGDRQLHAVLHGSGRFDRGGYRGARQARLELDLVRTHGVAQRIENFVEGRSADRAAQRP
jgi:hypothetical protein